MLSFLLFLAIGVGMGALAILGLVRKRRLKDFATQGDVRAYRNSLDTQAVRNAYAATLPY